MDRGSSGGSSTATGSAVDQYKDCSLPTQVKLRRKAKDDLLAQTDSPSMTVSLKGECVYQVGVFGRQGLLKLFL